MNRRERRAATGRSQTAQELHQTAVTHVGAGRLLDAQLCCQQALALDQNHAGSQHLMGVIALRGGQSDRALEWITRSIRLDPKPEYLSSLGKVLLRQGRFDEALKAFDKAIQLEPNNPDRWEELGEVLLSLKRLSESLLSFQHALELSPNHWGAAHGSALSLYSLGRFDDALKQVEHCDRLKAGQFETLQLRAVVLNGLKRFEEALVYNYKAHALRQDSVETLNNIGSSLESMGRPADALGWFDRALEIQPNSMQTMKNKGFTLKQLHKFDEAIGVYDQIVSLNPTDADAICDLSHLHLLTGQFDKGWIEREARLELDSTYPRFSEPRWLGDESIQGKTILVYADEGFGDAFQFARYLPMMVDRGARIVLAVDEPACSLFSGLPGVVECIPKSIVKPRSVLLPAFDMHCPIMSLPLAFKTTLDTIPPPLPHWPSVAPELVAAWQNRFHHHVHDKTRTRVALVWSGNPRHKNDHNRSIPLRALSDLLDADASFVSLQKDPRPEDQTTLRERSDIIDWTAGLTNYSETVALLRCLDLVITVDTSVAHLAATLGLPTWILLPYTPDFRWLLGRDDSPWYPTVRLFRQTETRDYGEVLDRVRRELHSFVVDKATSLSTNE